MLDKATTIFIYTRIICRMKLVKHFGPSRNPLQQQELWMGTNGKDLHFQMINDARYIKKKRKTQLRNSSSSCIKYRSSAAETTEQASLC